MTQGEVLLEGWNRSIPIGTLINVNHWIGEWHLVVGYAIIRYSAGVVGPPGLRVATYDMQREIVSVTTPSLANKMRAWDYNEERVAYIRQKCLDHASGGLFIDSPIFDKDRYFLYRLENLS